jgi:2-polyprenyl-3-methyl-5-hydroxy-6-metoxy-1,4-benzoquinol methylase
MISINNPANRGHLSVTGERTMPGLESENYWFRRHEAAYLHLVGEIDGGSLVEVGAGEGYGAAIFASTGASVLAIDYDELSIGHLAASYPSVSAVRGNLAALPVRTRSVDIVASLQVIEHVWDHPQFISECARVLRPGGSLIVTTPNRLTFSPGLDQPLNPFHTHEFTAWELSSLVAHNGLAVMAVRGVSNSERLASLDDKYHGFVAAQLASPPESWSDELRADVASVRSSDFVIDNVADDTCLDLMLLARRP